MMNRIEPFNRESMHEPLVPLFACRLSEDEIAASLRPPSGWCDGPRTPASEEALAARLGVRQAVAVSITAALHLAYLAAGSGRGTR